MFSSKTLLSRTGGFRMWMPTMPMTLVSVRRPRGFNPPRAIFRVLPKMTKWEIKEYLTKIYNLPVVKVNTMNYLGKRKRAVGRKVAYWKYKDFKKAIVTLDRSFDDFGIGMTIPDLDQKDTDEQQPQDTFQHSKN